MELTDRNKYNETYHEAQEQRHTEIMRNTIAYDFFRLSKAMQYLITNIVKNRHTAVLQHNKDVEDSYNLVLRGFLIYGILPYDVNQIVDFINFLDENTEKQVKQYRKQIFTKQDRKTKSPARSEA